MNEENRIIYKGMELTSDLTIRSQLITLDPYYVLADLLLKAKKPYGIKPNRDILHRTTESSVKLGSIPVKNDFFMDIIMETKFVDNNELYSAYGITTEYKKTKLTEEEKLQYTKETSKFYRGPSYDASLREIKRKLIMWSNNDILIAKILVTMAASSPEHPFWRTHNGMEKTTGMGFGNLWNHTNWSGW